MKTPGKLFFTLALVAVLGAVSSLAAATAKTNPPAKKGAATAKKAEPEPTTTLSLAEQVAARKSVFDNSPPKSGKDPFFPASERFKVVIAQPNKSHAAPPPVDPTKDLKLQGIYFAQGKPTAMINGKDFAPGDSALIKTPTGQIKIHCVEINEKSVVIKVEQETQTRTLFLKGLN
jgi:hypothetical protein